MAPAAKEALGSGKWHSPMQSSSSADGGTEVLVITAAGVGIAAMFGEETIVLGITVGSIFIVGTGIGWHAAANVSATKKTGEARILRSSIPFFSGEITQLRWDIAQRNRFKISWARAFLGELKVAGWIAPARREPRRV